MCPDCKRLQAFIEEQRLLIDQLRTLCDQLRAEVEDLKDRLGLNSKNSSKPPSSDQKRNTPVSTKGSRAGRRGFSRTRYKEEEIDKHVVCELDACPHCRSENLRERAGPAVHQQVDLPKAKGVVTQYVMK